LRDFRHPCKPAAPIVTMSVAPTFRSVVRQSASARADPLALLKARSKGVTSPRIIARSAHFRPKSSTVFRRLQLNRCKKAGFAERHIVQVACVFMYIVGSSFVFNIFFFSAPHRPRTNLLSFSDLNFRWGRPISPESLLTTCILINIVASGATFVNFRLAALVFALKSILVNRHNRGAGPPKIGNRQS